MKAFEKQCLAGIALSLVFSSISTPSTAMTNAGSLIDNPGARMTVLETGKNRHVGGMYSLSQAVGRSINISTDHMRSEEMGLQIAQAEVKSNKFVAPYVDDGGYDPEEVNKRASDAMAGYASMDVPLPFVQSSSKQALQELEKAMKNSAGSDAKLPSPSLGDTQPR